MNERFQFGSYHLDVTARNLHRDGVEVALGSRAFDILTALVRAEGAVLTTRELMAAAWPGLVVEDSNIRVQIAHLRRAIGCGLKGSRSIASVPGRGYSFVAEVSRMESAAERILDGESLPAARPISNEEYSSSPHKRTIGRELCVSELSQLLLQRRLVTVVGAGGLGKTTVAMETLASMRLFREKVFVLDLSEAHEQRVVYDIAAAVGYRPSGDVTLPGLAEYLECIRPLLVLESCEHVVADVADACSRIMDLARSVSFLCTSQEPLRISEEHVYHLRPLSTPPEEQPVGSGDLDSWAATKLFIQRAEEGGAQGFLSDDVADQVASICRRLDGNPHAIELVASRVGTYGVRGVSDMLASGVALQWQGRRDATPRHQTVEAALDWTYDLLPRSYKLALRRLSVFAGEFTIEAAIDVLSDQELRPSRTIGAISDLVEKSLVSTRTLEGKARLRLLDATRAYARARFDLDLDRNEVSRRHAIYYSERVRQQGYDLLPAELPPTMLRDEHAHNIRSAIDWASTAEAGSEFIVRLCSLAAPMFLQHRLFHDCLRACDAGIDGMPPELLNSPLHLSLIEAQAIALASTAKYGDFLKSCNAGIEISSRLNDRRAMLHLISGLHLEAMAAGRYADGSRLAAKYADVASLDAGSTEVIVADWLRGTSHHFLGEFVDADACFAAARKATSQSGLRNLEHFDIKAKLHATLSVARTKWAMGFPSQALHLAFKGIDEFRSYPDTLFACITMQMPIVLMNDLDVTCEGLIKELQSVSPVYRVGLRPSVIEFLKGMLCHYRGDLAEAERLLRRSLPNIRLPAPRVHVLHWLAETLLARGDLADAKLHIEDAISLAESSGGFFNLPDLSRTQAMILASGIARPIPSARSLLDEAMLAAKKQGALTWELNIAVSRVKLEMEHGDPIGAKRQLKNVYDRFSEGLETRSLREAEALIG